MQCGAALLNTPAQKKRDWVVIHGKSGKETPEPTALILHAGTHAYFGENSSLTDLTRIWFWRDEVSNFGLFHRLVSSPLQHSRTTPCDFAIHRQGTTDRDRERKRATDMHWLRDQWYRRARAHAHTDRCSIALRMRGINGEPVPLDAVECFAVGSWLIQVVGVVTDTTLIRWRHFRCAIKTLGRYTVPRICASVAYSYRVVQKLAPCFSHALTSSTFNFQECCNGNETSQCNVSIRRNFVIILSLKIPSHLKCVATLPCEMIASWMTSVTTHFKKLTTGNSVFISQLVSCSFYIKCPMCLPCCWTTHP